MGNTWIPVGGQQVSSDGWIGPDPKKFKPATEGGDPAGYTPAMPISNKHGVDHGLCETCGNMNPPRKGRKAQGSKLCTPHIIQARKLAEKRNEENPTPVTQASFVAADEDLDVED